MRFKPVNKEALSVGRPLAWALYDENGVLLLRKGYEIRSQAFLDAYLGRALYIQDAPPQSDPVRSAGGVHAFDLIRRVEKALPPLLRRPLDGSLPRMAPRLAEMVQLACQQDTNASLASILLEVPTSYAVRHVINVAIVTEILMKAMEIPASERISALAAALTMNIGMINLQDRLQEQLGSLTAEQRQTIHLHPGRGAHLLVQAGVADPIWLEAVAHHHELPDGSGYPKGLRQGQIGLASLMIAALDLYCAAISPRSYRPRLLPIEAMREIFGERGQKFGVEITDYIIKVIGLHPPGMRVRLANGEMAIVIRRGERAHCPEVRLLAAQDHQWQRTDQWRDTTQGQYALQEAAFVDAHDLDFDWRLLWRD